MKRLRSEPKLQKESVTQGVALACLLLLGGIAIVGPSGILSWSEHRRLLEQRQQEIVQLTAERDAIRNRVARLDPRQVDPDLAGELLRSNLNVVHPDEMVMMLK
ncbi:MAG: septum formation initiator family protein [Novosphingobium sp.]